MVGNNVKEKRPREQHNKTSSGIMTEKHIFLVSMLDGMDRNVSIIGEKLNDLEQRVHKLEKTEHNHRETA